MTKHYVTLTPDLEEAVRNAHYQGVLAQIERDKTKERIARRNARRHVQRRRDELTAEMMRNL